MSPAPTTLYITRHGETHWNVEGRLQGHLDSDLTERGLTQASRLAERLRELAPTRLYTSDLGRTVATARAIAAACGLTPLHDVRLRERHLGIFQGFTPEQIRSSHPDVWRRFQKRDPDFEIPQGESARQRAARILEALSDIAVRHRGEAVVVVGHGGTLDSIYRASARLPLGARRAFPMENASLNIVEYRAEQWHMVRWGDTEHLANSPRTGQRRHQR